MPWEALISKLMPEAEGVLHLGKKVSPELAQAYAKKLGSPMALKRLESAGALDSGGQFLKHMETNLGKDGARDLLKQEGVTEIKSASSPGRNLMGVAAIPAASQSMNPFVAIQDLGQKLKPAVDAYNNTKDAVAGKLTNEMNFGKDPGFQQVGTSVFSNALDPMNAIPGGAGIAAQGAMMLPDMTGAKDPASPQGEALSLQNYAKGGPVGNLKMIHHSATHTVLQHPNGHEVRLVHANLKPNELAEVKRYAEGGSVESPDEESTLSSLGRNVASGAASMVNPLLGVAVNDSMQPDQVSNPQVQNPQIPQAPQTSSDPMLASGMPNTAGVDEQVKGIQNMAKAVGAQGEQEQQAAQDLQSGSMDLASKYNENLASLDQERQNIMHDIGAGHIDPDHYTNSMSTGNKVGTAIGLILGGFAPQGTKNPAMEYLQKQIDNDMEAQKANLGRKENLLSANLRQYGNLHDAMSMTKVIQNEIYSAKITQAAASAKSPMAQAAAQQAIGQLKAQTAPLLQQVAQRQTALQGIKSGVLDPAQAVPYLVPKEHQKDVYNEIKAAQNTSANEGAMLDAFDKASKENTIAQTGFGLLRTPAAVLKMRAASLPMIHDAEGRVNEFESKTLNDLEPKPGDTQNKVAQKRQALIQFIEQKKSAPTARSFGLDLSQLPSTMSSPKSKFKPLK